MSQEKTYTLEEVDVIMEEHIMKNAETLRKNLRDAKEKSKIEYV